MNRQKVLAMLIASVISISGLTGCNNNNRQDEEDDTGYYSSHYYGKSKHISKTKSSASKSFFGLGSSAKGSVSS